MEPKALEMKVYVEPKPLRKNGAVLAEFLLLWAPFRIHGCRLISTSRGHDVWMPNPDTRITKEGKEKAVQAALQVFEEYFG
ncbi:hypothetical protein SAMN05444000_12655 [Shimia gijangensis]|uniref:Uncharacterized protein n=1 Tax=Shimia gijangensis TaxID=1470563 RepID=A0A1M6RV89_9RHOB|nr:hypothetical protein [Shimia gijangensis]SHK36364.1 hypothetical protein SAMN05444000_12655 [Shimia gijangensis]